MHSAMSVTLLSWPDNTANGSAKYWLIRFFESLLGNVDDDDDGGGISLSLSSSLSPFFEFDFLIFGQKSLLSIFVVYGSMNEWEHTFCCRSHRTQRPPFVPVKILVLLCVMRHDVNESDGGSFQNTSGNRRLIISGGGENDKILGLIDCCFLVSSEKPHFGKLLSE